MATPLATVADALIEFILSLLRDPAAVAEFKADPQKVLDSRGLGDIGADDVRAVAPVVVDHPSVSLRPQGPSHPGPGPGPTHPVYPPSPHPEPPVIREISTIANKFHIDNRTTIVDQSVNQNIWAKGDVTQYFDQKAVLAVGDESVAAGNNAWLDNSQTDVTAGDIAIGNTETNTTVTDSFNDSSTNVQLDAQADGSFNDSSSTVDVNAEITDSFQSTSNVVDTSVVLLNDGEISGSSFQADQSVDINNAGGGDSAPALYDSYTEIDDAALTPLDFVEDDQQ
ncbi:MAG: IniB N-terminal domain-containing protein [Actinobacteria bacterium]|uniref:Uncharacterized protein n=1 Tax=Phycicoccus elongatus Lp2 TaxID=1193181 RepID=N0DYV0_9MICO|nr:IniB N-terminal domain-containing protein [Phycicoccus elongatus]MCA0323119.1 IniB N-terminal domain-containing protein [Actinomycetota bacterium]CCH68520.1 conserved hypothetical protein [Phycicoccus elongatus Lp2]